ncbi:prolyl oligopeptidase family serine peptidase [Flavihumibacter sp. CACIAM 22H1]|uniref:S9 family peptidase n=1 Tax=Flavihumibacter sp. CACIAM 22H1 TaxID=1812911 RepID=UPI0007A8F115|nr:prolyl oligopeptidase family serine peptidase [Flavihumibacter sp. CACIAM 22H1]KYP15431.1 MAG: peptidase S9 [Flavihumibacter sp. CACIAM 22H1]
MKTFVTGIVLVVFFGTIQAQSELGPLTVEKIMKDPSWIGSSPSNLQWGADGTTLYFDWNPDNAPADSLYFIRKGTTDPQKLPAAQRKDLLFARNLVYNQAGTQYLYTKDGDIYWVDLKSGKTRRITETVTTEINPVFSFQDKKIVYQQNQDLFAWDPSDGTTQQLISFQKTAPAAAYTGKDKNSQEEWLKKDQLQWLQVIRERKEKRDASDAYNKSIPKAKEIPAVYYGDKLVRSVLISADGRFISYSLFKPDQSPKRTIVPNYVTESGFTEDIPARTKVGTPTGSSELYVYDRKMDTLFQVKTDSLPGLTDLPDYLKDYPARTDKATKTGRTVSIGRLSWSPTGANAVVEVFSNDNKDRWILQLIPAEGRLKLIDRQRDEAWIGGPGIGFSGGWINETNYWFQSEATGYSHLYRFDLSTYQKTALSSGNYEVQTVQLSNDKKHFYITTNEVDAGEKQFYRLPVGGGKATRLTTGTGANQVVVSPNEKQLAILYSYTNKPWELFLQENKAMAKAVQVTSKAASPLFKSYPWRDPEIVQVPAADGKLVRARLYRPASPDPKKPAVIFVHGAGYLQNAHKWWSSYFREYMFHNMLADQGYYVLDMDYRGSAGYGRDWRTGIYRHMGGKDLSDHIDGAKWLVSTYGINPKRIGIYGGSYGGFITLMGLFTAPGTFAAGAALRPVTDWAHYNHGYTSNILNTPAEDSIAYRKSSPIYFAEGLSDHLLICHGVVDVNVHFQDVVRLNQRLIELGKDNWELALYPVEDHGFVEPSSWTDEYKRIFKLFEEVLKKQ